MNAYELSNLQPASNNERQYETTVNYSCPANRTIPDRLISNFSFDYSDSAGLLLTVQAYCEIDRYDNLYSS